MNESEKFLETSLAKMKNLIDVNQSIGSPIMTDKGSMILPLTEIKISFITGGSEFGSKDQQNYPFGGMMGANIQMKPCGFLELKDSELSVISLKSPTVIEQIISEEVPKIINYFKKEKRTN